MAYYLIVYALINLTLLFKKVISNKKICKILEISVPLLFLLLMMCLRSYTVGRDILGYYKNFENPSFPSFGLKTEFSFNFLVYIFSKAFNNFRIFLFFEYLIFYFAIFLYIYYFSDSPQISLLVLLLCPLFAFSISALRQTFGIAFCIFATIIYKKNSGWKKYTFSILFWLISITFHVSLISFGLFFIVSFFKPSLKNVPFLLMIYLCFCVFSKYVLHVANLYLNLEYGRNGFFIGIPKISILYLVIFLLLVFINDGRTFINEKFLITDDETREKNKLDLMLVFTFVCFQGLASYNEIYPRLGVAFIFPLIILIPNVYKLISNKKIYTILYILLVAASIFAFWYENVHSNVLHTTPFSWF